jgi:muramidase (phage lysozyme)
MAEITAEAAGGRNVVAFLDMLRYSEIGEALLKRSDRGYNVIVGSYYRNADDFNLNLMKTYTDHPNVLVRLPKLGISSTAAGGYQILARYWKVYKVQLRLPDFSPLSQDKVALQLIRECKALDDIKAGRFDAAVFKCKSRWASLPGAGYGQNEHSLVKLRNAFQLAGGVLA